MLFPHFGHQSRLYSYTWSLGLAAHPGIQANSGAAAKGAVRGSSLPVQPADERGELRSWVADGFVLGAAQLSLEKRARKVQKCTAANEGDFFFLSLSLSLSVPIYIYIMCIYICMYIYMRVY